MSATRVKMNKTTKHFIVDVSREQRERSRFVRTGALTWVLGEMGVFIGVENSDRHR